MALISKLTEIADAIREKTGDTCKYTLDEMPIAIAGITTGSGGGGEDLPAEAFLITGTGNYRFMYGGWDWFLNNYGNRVTTKDILISSMMFSYSNVDHIDFDLNMTTSAAMTSNDMQKMFQGCKYLKNIPKINNARPSNISYLFSDCNNVREIPDDFFTTWDWSHMNTLTSQYSGNMNAIFEKCYSLRKVPLKWLSQGNPNISHSYALYNNCFSSCASLDEVLELPCPHFQSTFTTNAFSSTFSDCYRLKNATFALKEDGTPYVVNWKSQVIDFSKFTGYATSVYKKYILENNSGITADKEVKGSVTYQELKNDPDWFTCDIAYCRYNHDSAVATINSLPDTSAYLASAGGTNTIKFKGAAGSATDGGAINTLTEEEIAVATSKGWTVTLV